MTSETDCVIILPLWRSRNLLHISVLVWDEGNHWDRSSGGSAWVSPQCSSAWRSWPPPTEPVCLYKQGAHPHWLHRVWTPGVAPEGSMTSGAMLCWWQYSVSSSSHSSGFRGSFLWTRFLPHNPIIGGNSTLGSEKRREIQSRVMVISRTM